MKRFRPITALLLFLILFQVPAPYIGGCIDTSVCEKEGHNCTKDDYCPMKKSGKSMDHKGHDMSASESMESGGDMDMPVASSFLQCEGHSSDLYGALLLPEITMSLMEIRRTAYLEGKYITANKVFYKDYLSDPPERPPSTHTLI